MVAHAIYILNEFVCIYFYYRIEGMQRKKQLFN